MPNSTDVACTARGWVAAATLLLVGCRQQHDIHERQIATLRAQLASRDRALRDAQSRATAQERLATLRLEQAEQEKARADGLAERLQRVANLVGEVSALQDRQRVAIELAAAEPRVGVTTRASPPSPSTAAPGGWQDLEKQQKSRRDEGQRRLQSTTVYVAGGDSYHLNGCDRLYTLETLSSGLTYRKYVGSSITLQTAHDRHLTRDATCGPPSYEFTYR